MITQSVIILIASASVIIAVFYYSKKHKKVAPVAIAIIATAAVTFIAIRTDATSTSSDDITIDNNVTFYYKDCQGICYNANSGTAKGTKRSRRSRDYAICIKFQSRKPRLCWLEYES